MMGVISGIPRTLMSGNNIFSRQQKTLLQLRFADSLHCSSISQANNNVYKPETPQTKKYALPEDP